MAKVAIDVAAQAKRKADALALIAEEHIMRVGTNNMDFIHQEYYRLKRRLVLQAVADKQAQI